jgi:hypothetical protein
MYTGTGTGTNFFALDAFMTSHRYLSNGFVFLSLSNFCPFWVRVFLQNRDPDLNASRMQIHCLS